MNTNTNTLASIMAARIGYQPSREQVTTITLLVAGKSPSEVAASLSPREADGRIYCGLTEQWTFSLCARLGFGESDRDCRLQGWATMQAKARELAGEG